MKTRTNILERYLRRCYSRCYRCGRTTRSNGLFNCLLSRPVLKQVNQKVKFLQGFFPKPFSTQDSLLRQRRKTFFPFTRNNRALWSGHAVSDVTARQTVERTEDGTAWNVLGSSLKQLTPRRRISHDALFQVGMLFHSLNLALFVWILLFYYTIILFYFILFAFPLFGFLQSFLNINKLSWSSVRARVLSSRNNTVR